MAFRWGSGSEKLREKTDEAFGKLLKDGKTQCTAADARLDIKPKYEKVKDRYIALAPRAFERHESEKEVTENGLKEKQG